VFGGQSTLTPPAGAFVDDAKLAHKHVLRGKALQGKAMRSS
jgi:hypothetical protein